MFRPQEQTPGNPRYGDDDGKDGDYVKGSDDDRDNDYEEGDVGTSAKKRRASFLQAKGTNAKGKSSAKLLTRKLRMANRQKTNHDDGLTKLEDAVVKLLVLITTLRTLKQD